MARTTKLADQLRIKPGTRARIGRRDPAATFGYDKATAQAATAKELARCPTPGPALGRGETSVLVVLQGIDSGRQGRRDPEGDDAFNPQGCPVTSLQGADAEELAHDYLWRVHRQVPRQGRDRDLQPVALRGGAHRPGARPRRRRRVWSKRYDHINEFERMLADEGTTIVKFFLHISKDEQRERFQARSTTRPSAGSSERRSRGAQALGRLPGRLRGRDHARPRPAGRRGTSCRPTASGSGTWPSRRSWPTRWPGSDPPIPNRPDLPPNLVIE